MKKISIIILSVALAQFVNAQTSFYSGALVFSANYGVAGNSTNQHYNSQPENVAQSLNVKTAAANYSITGECGVLNWLGLGLISQVNSYYMKSDPVTKTLPSANSFDLGGTVNFHIVRLTHFDFLTGFNYGNSQLRYHTNDGVTPTTYSNGTWGDLHATARIYRRRFGASLSVYAPTARYSNFQGGNAPNGEYVINYWRSAGCGASLGIQYRLL